MLFTLTLITAPIHALKGFGKTRDAMINDHRNTLIKRLEPLEEKDRAAIVLSFDQEISSSYGNSELTNNNNLELMPATIISQYGKTKAELEARKYTTDRQKIQQFADEWYALIISKLCNNEPLDNVFDRDLTRAAQQQFGKQPAPQQHTYHYQPAPIQPKPSAPVINQHPTQPQVHTFPARVNTPVGIQPLYYAHSESDKAKITRVQKEWSMIILPALSKANLSQCNQKRLEGFFYKSIVEQKSSLSPQEHVQNAFLSLFEVELHSVKMKLSLELDKYKLENSITATRESLYPFIRTFTPQSADKFQQMIATLEDTVVENAGIACSICTETYKEDDKFGSVEKVTLRSPYSGNPCHSVCKTCAGQIHACPICRGQIDPEDIKKQVNKADNPANWRP